MSLRAEFVELASAEGANLSRLCRQFGISRPTAYQLCAVCRRGRGGIGAPVPATAHLATANRCRDETQVVAVRDAHPTWVGANSTSLTNPGGRAGAAGQHLSNTRN